MAEENTFDWGLLANYAASAANLLRAFEYAETVFKAISAADYKMKVAEGALVEKLDELDSVKAEIEDAKQKWAKKMEADKTQFKKEFEDLESRTNDKVAVTEGVLAELQGKIEAQKVAFSDEEADFKKKISGLKNELARLTSEYNKVKTEYEQFVSKFAK